MECMIVTYMSNLDGIACSHHIDDRIPYFDKSGINVRVITSVFAPRNTSYAQSRVFFLHPEEIRNYLRFKLKQKIKNRALYGICLNLAFLPLLPFNLMSRIILPRHDQSLWWSLPAFGLMRKQCRYKRPDVIYSTGGSHGAHLAAALVSRATGIPWVAEFQDPPIHGYCCKSKTERKFILWMEKMMMERASKVVFLTDNAKNESEKRTGGYAKGTTIYPGSDPVLFKNINPKRTIENLLTISHIGSLGGNRNLRAFFLAMERAIEVEPKMASDVQIEIIGGMGKELKNDFGNFRFKNILKMKGKLSRESVLERMASTDVLLLVQGLDDVSSGQIPCKTYEYLYARRPILGLLYHNDELSDMLMKRGHYTAKADDVADIERAILEVYSRWKLGNLNMIENPSPISIRDAVAELVTVLEQSVDKFGNQ